MLLDGICIINQQIEGIIRPRLDAGLRREIIQASDRLQIRISSAFQPGEDIQQLHHGFGMLIPFADDKIPVGDRSHVGHKFA
ncbi:hypothetical protein D3C86_2124660 [compost metagenome]